MREICNLKVPISPNSFYRKVRKKAKIRNRYKQVPHLTPDTIRESEKNTRNITYKRTKRSALSQQVITRLQGTGKTVYQRKNKTQITKRIHKRSYALERSVKKLEGLHMSNGTNVTINSDVDIDIKILVRVKGPGPNLSMYLLILHTNRNINR